MGLVEEEAHAEAQRGFGWLRAWMCGSLVVEVGGHGGLKWSRFCSQ